MTKPTFIACDFKSREECIDFLQPFAGESLYLKIGMKLFYREGREFVEVCQSMGHKIFLDLKLHDIPNTVGSALKNLRDLNVDYITIHASGGYEMMHQAQLAIEGTKTKLLAVTVLTSIDQEILSNELMNPSPLKEVALGLAASAKRAGVAGCICSAFEAQDIKNHVGEDFLCITPGIRLADGSVDDQKRIMTPTQAVANGADGIVVGRAITKSETPYETYMSIKESINE